MKYQVGDQVWYAGWESVQARIECPDCAGQGRIRVLLPDDSVVSVECCNCKHGYEGPTGYLRVHDRRAVAILTTITGLEMSEGKTEWRTAVSYCVSESDLFDNEADAVAAAKLKAEEADREERERVNRKEKDSRSWAWNVSYHRKCIRDAQKQIEHHSAKLAAANLKAKSDKVAS